MNGLLQDIRYALRQLGKNPGLTAILVLTLALGIGANTGIFSVLNGWLLRPLPVTAPEQIVVLAPQQKEGPQGKFSYSDLLDFRKQADMFSDLFAYEFGAAGLSVNGRANEFVFSAVTGNYFYALGLKPALGRLFLPGEGETAGDPLIVVLGFSYWQKKLGGDPGVVGKQVLFNGRSATVVGVAPEEFHGSLFAFNMDGYVPLNGFPRAGSSSGFWSERADRELFVQGRLKTGISLAQARTSVGLIAERLAAQYPETNKGVTVRVIPETSSRPAPLVASFVPAIATLFLTLAGLVLLLACMNGAGVLLARAMSREHEMAIRVAVGAGNGRIIRQVLTESLVIAVLGGVAGALAGQWALTASGAFIRSVTTTPNFGYRMDCSFDWKVFAYTLTTVVVTGIFVGLWPALRARHTDVIARLHGSNPPGSTGRGHHGFRSTLVVAQVAGSLALLVVSGLFVRSLGRAERMDLGFNPDHMAIALMDPQQIGYDQIRTDAFYRELEKRVREIPGVLSVSLAISVPLEVPGKAGSIYVAGRPPAQGEKPRGISYNSVSPTYFETMQIPLLRGRAFSDSDDTKGRSVAIVSRTMAEKLWPNENPIGKVFSLKAASGPFVEVVGVAEDGQYMFLSPERQPYFYIPLAQDFSSFRSLQVRSSLPSNLLISGVEEQIRRIAPDLPLIDVRTMEQVVQGLGGLFVVRLAASLAGVVGLLGMILAVTGVYGVVSFSVSRRTREIGIRVALGAERSDVLRLVSRQALKLVAGGLGTGLFLAWALTRAMSRLLVGIGATDPLTFASVAVLLAGITFFACYIPARRATTVDPAVALRYE